MFLLGYGLFVRTWRDVSSTGTDAERPAIFPRGDDFDVPERSVVSPVFRHVADRVNWSRMPPAIFGQMPDSSSRLLARYDSPAVSFARSSNTFGF
jgi:hypothetical protein